MAKIGINGFGRIGRTITRINKLQSRFDFVAINDIDPYVDNMTYLLKYDSTYGKFPGEVKNNQNAIYIDDAKIQYFSQPELHEVDWGSLDVDLVIDSSGVTSNIENAKKLVAKNNSVKKVVVTHSSEITDKEIIMGINHETLEATDHVVSNSICDANALAHVLQWIDDKYKILSGSITTLHPWLSYQNLVDGPAISKSKPGVVWKDFALGRASSDSLIPKNTTAVSAIEKVLPNLKDKLLSFSYRVPTDIVASSDITLNTSNHPNLDELKIYLESKINQSNYVRSNYESLVSLDYEEEEVSAVLDMQWLRVRNGIMKLVLWYDNEWGYSARTLDLAEALLRL
jgi:glyceraldehyde 3-phosphate dehydrogenase